jgi:GxxExxY protein
MSEGELMSVILEEAIHVHKELGPEMLESVYKICLVYRLQKRGLHVQVEKAIPVIFEEIKMECGYRADIIVEDKIVVETKSIDGIAPLHIAQVLTYLRCLKLHLGIILNFNNVLLKDGIRRVVNGY